MEASAQGGYFGCQVTRESTVRERNPAEAPSRRLFLQVTPIQGLGLLPADGLKGDHHRRGIIVTQGTNLK